MSEAALPRVAVTGAGGFIAGALEARLVRRARLRGLFRAEGEAARRWRRSGHEVVVGDIGDESALRALVGGADVVHHLAARSGKDDPAESRRVNVEGTRRLARAAREAGVRRMVYVSTISVYAATPAPEGVITEEVRPQRTALLNPYSRTKYEAEEALRALRDAHQAPPFTVVRPTNVYGPGGRAWVTDWIRRMQKVPVVPGGNVEIDVVYLDDVAEGLIQAAGSDAAADETLHLGHERVLLGVYVQLLARAVGLRAYRLPEPLDLLVRLARERGYQLIHGGQMSLPLTRQARFPHDRAARLIGYRPRITLEEGLEEVARWWREVSAAASG